MPYKVQHSGKGYKVFSPNHPRGFSKKPQSKAKAAAQQRALYANATPKERASFSSLIKKK